MEIIPGIMTVKQVNQFCPSCGAVDKIVILHLTDKNAYVAWCPCGAVFNQDKVLTTHNND